MTPAITLESGVAEKLRSELDGRILRISFTTGCGGSGYRLAFSDEIIDGDHVIASDEIRIALDDMAFRNLDGAKLVVAQEEDGYIVDHPSAAVCVWCG